MKKASLAAVLVATLSSLSLSAQSTWVVDASGGPGSDFATIQPAIDAAQDGDRVLIVNGVYGAFEVVGKSIDVYGNGAFVFDDSNSSGMAPIQVRDLAAGQAVSIRNLLVFRGQLGAPQALLIEDCAGLVRLESVNVDSYAARALEVRGCQEVLLANCFFQTNLVPAETSGAFFPEPGMLVEDTQDVFAFQCIFIGSHGLFIGQGQNTSNDAVHGGEGVVIIDSRVHFSGGGIAGGSGLLLPVGNCNLGADGGTGIVLRSTGGSPPEVSMQDVQVSGGIAADGDLACGPQGVPGLPGDVQAGQLTSSPGGSIQYFSSGVGQSGSNISFNVHAEAGDRAIIFFALAPAQGVQVRGQYLFLPLGSIQRSIGFSLGSSGNATQTLNVPPLPLGASSLSVTTQALVLGNSGPRLSSPSAMLLLP